MKSQEIREKFLQFFKKRGHKIMPSSSLIPENDPSALFISAGMQPLVPFLLGESHPQGRRLANIQKCLRTNDIDEVGDATHITFFEMMGYWSLGDYFKEEAIKYSFDFFTKKLGIKKEKLFIPAYDYVMKCSHLFNLLDARGAISVIERTNYVARIRNLANKVAIEYIKSLSIQK